uniref:Uncharacterized protein n=1 Tax=Oryza brachyantha TaxID=4533 RepID=J3LN64_ORYBR
MSVCFTYHLPEYSKKGDGGGRQERQRLAGRAWRRRIWLEDEDDDRRGAHTKSGRRTSAGENSDR